VPPSRAKSFGSVVIRVLDCPTGKSGGDGKTQKSSPRAKNNPVVPSGKSMASLRAFRARSRGAFRDRHERWMRDAMDARCRQTSGAGADGEVVWSWRLDAGVNLAMMLAHHAGDGGKKARSPERARKKPLKPIAQGRPDCFGEPVVTTLVSFFISDARLRVRIEHPAFPAPSVSRVCSTTWTHFAWRERWGMSLPAANAVRLRKEANATKQSSERRRKQGLDCFAGARNDDGPRRLRSRMVPLAGNRLVP
jgi:hypothetical protein